MKTKGQKTTQKNTAEDGNYSNNKQLAVTERGALLSMIVTEFHFATAEHKFKDCFVTSSLSFIFSLRFRSCSCFFSAKLGALSSHSLHVGYNPLRPRLLSISILCELLDVVLCQVHLDLVSLQT